MKIGFPRALYYFDYYPFWAGFFQQLGIEVVTSPPTNRRIMDQGLKKASDETCLPLKLLAGHIQELKNVDAIFLPRLVSVEENTYNCPKILGVPESMLSAVPPGIPVLSSTLNWRKGRRHALKDLQVLGSQLGKNKSDVRRAFSEGLKRQARYQESRGLGWDFERSVQEIELVDSGSSPSTQLKAQKRGLLKISLVGHSYLTQEHYANLGLLRRLREKAEVELTENVRREDIQEHLLGMRKKLFWSHSKQIFGAGQKFVNDSQVDGIIYLSCFGCGTDSMVQEMLARIARKQHKPYMVITLDEHSGEAGLVTRLEAFLDMVERRKILEGNVSAHGERLDRDSNAL